MWDVGVKHLIKKVDGRARFNRVLPCGRARQYPGLHYIRETILVSHDSKHAGTEVPGNDGGVRHYHSIC
jgi:hypothetical protein